MSLSGDDFVALCFSIVLEILLVGAVCFKEVEPLIDRRVRAARQAFDRLPDAELGVFVHLLSAPDDRIRPLFSLIDRYRWQVWPWDLVVVAHGTGDPQLDQLGHVLSILTALGWVRRCHLIPKAIVRWVAWWRWPEMKGARFRETYRIDLAAFDELKLAELCSRMRRLPTGPIIDLEAEPAGGGPQRGGAGAGADGKRAAGRGVVIDADFEGVAD